MLKAHIEQEGVTVQEAQRFLAGLDMQHAMAITHNAGGSHSATAVNDLFAADCHGLSDSHIVRLKSLKEHVNPDSPDSAPTTEKVSVTGIHPLPDQAFLVIYKKADAYSIAVFVC